MINIKSDYLVIGVMSGTSMDGLDVSCAKYYKKNNQWSFDLIASQTFLYDDNLKTAFARVFNKQICIDTFDKEFGHVIADYISFFLEKNSLKPDFISSHGHTIFHHPQKGITRQIGSGHVIAKKLKIPVVSNFRQQDIHLGGQGAPLVPIGDKLLFSDFDSCLNLGGIANVSYDYNGRRLAYDICPCNILLNYLSNQLGQLYDREGKMAASGIVNLNFLNKLNRIGFYQNLPPKSLGREYINKFHLAYIKSSELSTVDLLATCVEHISFQISHLLEEIPVSNIFVTGGGAFNDFLIHKLRSNTNVDVIVPSNDIVEFKESIIFGFLGVLKILNQPNCLASVTGASQDHCAGDLYLI